MTTVFRIFAPVLSVCASLAALHATAHEFWISPDAYQVPSGGTIEARLRNGEILEGVELAYFEGRAARHEGLIGSDVTPLSARSGDRPAITLRDVPDGLAVLVHETTPSRLTYNEMAKFEKFAAHKDFPNALNDHAARGLSTERFLEYYTRHAKTLIAVGDGLGQDRDFGMKTEFIALTNPYDPNFTHRMIVELRYKGAPRGNAQVEVFERGPEGAVDVRLTRTNAQGIATIRTKPGHEYLLDAVVLRRPEYSAPNVAWETLWAALTFATPQ